MGLSTQIKTSSATVWNGKSEVHQQTVSESRFSCNEGSVAEVGCQDNEYSIRKYLPALSNASQRPSANKSSGPTTTNDISVVLHQDMTASWSCVFKPALQNNNTEKLILQPSIQVLSPQLAWLSEEQYYHASLAKFLSIKPHYHIIQH